MKKTNYLKTLLCITASVALIGCSGTRYNRSTGQYIDDKSTAARVKGVLVQDSMVAAGDVHVESFRGNVHLTGFVDHSAQKERVSQLTRNVEGVNWFKNDILVKETLPGESQGLSSQQINEAAGAERESEQGNDAPRARMNSGGQGWEKGSIGLYDPAADISIRRNPGVASPRAAEQQGAFRSSTDISSEPAGSSNDPSLQSNAQSSSRGKITLSGTVGSEEQKQSIENSIKSIPGVGEVENELEVQDQ